jgi:hypothetical protein
MSALVRKEIRLLLPAYALAMALAIAPVWLWPARSHDRMAFSSVAFWFAAILLPLSSWGREFNLRMFGLMLAQPATANRIWWTKIAVLGVAMATLFGALCLSCGAAIYVDGGGWDDFRVVLLAGGTALAVAFATGLWTTLLLRQMVAAFWFTILIPGPIAGLINWLRGDNSWAYFAGFGVYSVVGFLWAWWRFSRMQEVGWTGGVITLPAWRSARAGSCPARRVRRPLAALVWKELQLHQISLAGMAALFLLHLGAVALRKTDHSIPDVMRPLLYGFGAIWLFISLFVGSLSVAEERKLETMDGQLCLPVSYDMLFIIKLLFALVVGGLLSAGLFWAAEGIGIAIHAPTEMKLFNVGIFLWLALIGFYASTLARGLLQALAVAVIMLSLNFIGRLWPLSVSHSLADAVAGPALAGTLIWLAFGNFTSVAETRRVLARNALVLCAAIWVVIWVSGALAPPTWMMPVK